MDPKKNLSRYDLGINIMSEHFGAETTQAYVEKIKSISEVFARVNVEFPFGDLYSRKVLDDRVRELATIAALTTQGFSLPQLRLHIKAALQCGATREEVLEIITQMIAYCGFPAATNALLTAKEVFDELD